MKNINDLRKMMELSQIKSEAYQHGYFDALADVERQHEQPVDKTRKGTQHGYDEQLLRPHRVVPRHKGDSRRQK